MSFEADLRAAREARGLSLDDIQQETRIPVDVLRRFEDGDLIGDPTYNEVYLKAFLQSYAKAVGVPSAAVLDAYRQRDGYRGALHPDFEAAEPAPRPEAETRDDARLPDEGPREASEDRPPAAARPAAPAAVEALRQAPDPERARVVSQDKPKTLAQARVNRPAVPTARRSFDKNWGTILGLFAVIVLVLGGILWALVFRGDDEPQAPDTVVVSEEGTEAPVDSAAVGAGAATGGPRFQTPIRVALTAAGDGLQSFRVTEDAEDRRPYWIEAGDTQSFEADSVLVLWGEDPSADFTEATVELQGFRFTPRNGAPLRIDRASGQALLDSLASAPPPAPAPAAPAAGE